MNRLRQYRIYEETTILIDLSMVQVILQEKDTSDIYIAGRCFTVPNSVATEIYKDVQNQK